MVGERDGIGGSNLWAPAEMARRAVARSHENVVTAWEDVQLADPGETGQGVRLLEYWRIVYKYKWLIAAIVVVSLAMGAGLTLITPKVYTANTTLEIDRESDNVVGMGQVEPMDKVARDQEFFQTQYGLLKSWSLAARVAQAENLANDPAFLSALGVRHPPKGPRAADGSWIAGYLEGRLGVYPVRDSRLVRLTFDSPDPELSARLANAFADNFISSNLERRFDASAYARNFLEQRLAELKAKLEESERQLVAYATQQQIIQISQPGGGKDAPPPQSLDATDLSGINSALTGAKANLVMAEQRWRATQAAPGLSAPDILADPTVQQLREDRAKLQSQYNDQLKIYKPDYPDMLQLKAQIDDIDKQLTVAADTIRRSLKTQADAAAQQVAALESQVGHLKTSVLDERNREIQYNILQREVDTTRSLYDGLLQRYKEIGIAGGITTNNISIVDRARAPGGPSKPQPMRNLAMAGITGLGMGVMLAFLLETLDQAIRKPADVEGKLGLAVLGCVPLLEKGVQPLEALSDLRSPFSEAYHSIRSNLAFSTNDGAPRVLALTSARPEEGKSTTSFALAQGFARVGMRVLLVDLDLRNPSQHKTLGADNRVGASSLLTGAVRLQGAVQPTDWPNLFLIPSGPLPPSPAELLIGPRLVAFVKEATEHFDIVILDGPPVMGLADAPLIASVATGAVLTIEAGRTSRAQARAAIKRLRLGNARLFGAVLTKFDSRKTSYGYGYNYAYEYDYQYGRKEPQTAANQPAVLTQERSRKTPPAA
ncbi:MAG TPA: polysaccharide biosynthesis tyrosine autokinase [Caulobacteraceae bacterium]|nr:polysaccharide biosynthesis tyrosine autokinase [Caulobacteraceae bacterium]